MSDGIASPRPLADLPPDALPPGELARRWGVSLVLTRPLELIGEVPLEEIATRGPALCSAVLEAVRSDAALERLTQAGAEGSDDPPAVAVLELSGVRELALLVDAVEALRRVLWDGLLEQLSRRRLAAGPSLLADACDRVGHVCARLLSAAARELEPAEARDQALPPAAVAAWPPGADAPRSALRRQAGAVIVDERLPRAPTAARPGAAQERDGPRGGGAAFAGREEIEIRDERIHGGPGAWIGAIGRQLERFRAGASPFCVLLVEALGYERMRRTGPPGEADRLAAALEELLADELRASGDVAGADRGPLRRRSTGAGSVTRERPGRLWLIAPAHDRAAGEALAGRLRHAIARRGTPWLAQLEPTIGTAACPDDGREAAALAAHADVSVYAARAASRASSGRGGPPPRAGG